MASWLLALLLPFLIVTAVSGHNITDLLSQFSDFSSFNSLLSQTNIASEINSRQTITVLAARNKAVSAISDQPAYIQKRILALHVILDYYDSNKLGGVIGKTAMVSTLFETMGHTTGHNGFLNFTVSSGNQVVVRSSQPGGKDEARIVKLVATQPFNLSVVEISNLIVPPAIGANHAPAPNAPVLAPAPVPAFAPAEAPNSFGTLKLPATAGTVVAWTILAVAASLGVL